jgi:hypothetical protein
VVDGDTWDKNLDCGLCNNHCAARYRCYRHEEPMERCNWKETPLQVIVNGEEKTIVDISLTVNPILQVFYGLWRNETSVFLNTATNKNGRILIIHSNILIHLSVEEIIKCLIL